MLPLQPLPLGCRRCQLRRQDRDRNRRAISSVLRQTRKREGVAAGRESVNRRV